MGLIQCVGHFLPSHWSEATALFDTGLRGKAAARRVRLSTVMEPHTCARWLPWGLLACLYVSYDGSPSTDL